MTVHFKHVIYALDFGLDTISMLVKSQYLLKCKGQEFDIFLSMYQ